MKWFAILTLFFCAYAWEPEDHQIFELTDALRKVEPGADFYSILDIKDRKADAKTINKAYRKKSIRFHPDSMIASKLTLENSTEEAAVVYKLLTSISTTLKNKKLRSRYDKHLARGFPTWRGNGYHYSRFEPGVLTVLFFLVVAISVSQYAIAWIFYFRKKKAAEIANEEAKEEINTKSVYQIKKELKRKQKEEGAPKLSKKDLKKQSATDLFEAAIIEVPEPSFKDVLLVSLPLSIYKRFTSAPEIKEEAETKKSD